LKERRPTCSTIASPLPTHQSHLLKTHTKSRTPRERLSPKLVTSPPRKKSRTTFGSPIIDLEKDEERTCSYEIGNRGGEELYATITQGNIKEEPEPNLDKVIDNIQVEPIMSIELVVSIAEPTQPMVVTIESSQPIQLVVELVQIENP
jgi:hypothetical protein